MSAPARSVAVETRPGADGGARTARGRVHVPAALRNLLVAAFLLGLAWAFVVPVFQAPDEPAHYGYVQSLAERSRLPGTADRPIFSTQQNDASTASNADQAAAALGTRMEWVPGAFRAFGTREANRPADQRSDGGGPNPAANNPPLSYLVDTLAYRLTPGRGLLGHLLVLRAVSVLWLLVTIAGVWLLAGEIFSGDRLLQLLAASVAALTPMMTFVSASLTPDSMLYAVWSLALWLGVRILRRGLTLKAGVAFFGLVGVGCLVKATSYALIPGALLVLAIGVRRLRPGRGAALRLTAAPLTVLALTAGAWLVIARLLDRSGTAQITSAASGGTNIRELLSYIWQFYLPRTPLQNDYPFPASVPNIPIYDVWIKTSWGSFGWLETRFPEPLYLVLTAVTVVLIVAAAAAVWRRRSTVDLAIVSFCALVTLSLLAGLHWTDYHLLEGGSSGFIQGRYAFPVIGFFGVGFAAAVSLVRPARRPLVAAVLLAALITLEIYSLGLTLDRFYA